jgi:ATPase subunit of ABC transporter with duplicated ATPase domains
MSRPDKTHIQSLVAATIGLIVAGGVVWIAPQAALPKAQGDFSFREEERLAKLEQAVADLTEALHERQAQNAAPAAGVAAAENAAGSREAFARAIREEVRLAMEEESAKARQTREEAAAEAELLATPENQEAYRSATDVVTRAVADKHWTPEDREILSAAIAHLTRDQMMELTGTLVPAVNSGEVKVEVSGPLF